jgi:hypothetical protein
VSVLCRYGASRGSIPGLVLGLQDVDDADHVMLGDTLGDADNEGDLSRDGLLYRRRGDRRGNEDSAAVFVSSVVCCGITITPYLASAA